jgi:hypothetical protein
MSIAWFCQSRCGHSERSGISRENKVDNEDNKLPPIFVKGYIVLIIYEALMLSSWPIGFYVQDITKETFRESNPGILVIYVFHYLLYFAVFAASFFLLREKGDSHISKFSRILIICNFFRIPAQILAFVFLFTANDPTSWLYRILSDTVLDGFVGLLPLLVLLLFDIMNVVLCIKLAVDIVQFKGSSQ